MSYPHETSGTVDPKEVAIKMAVDYSRGVKDHTTRLLEALVELCWSIERPEFKIEDVERDAANLISKHLSIESVAIAARDADGLYRYKAIVGLDKEVADGFKKLVYTQKQLLEETKYPSHAISTHTKLYLGEEHPYADGEEFTYMRPGLIGMRRRTLTDSLEADYLDIYFYGPNRDILGFIEISGTRTRKLPDTTTIRWIELIAGILSHAHRLKQDTY